jgi:c(7)-type cytochrome triheme protein
MKLGRQRVLAVALVVMLTALPVASALAVLGDIVFQTDNEARGTAPAVFPHWVHRVRYKCYACHPAVFEMKAGANPTTMDTIEAGEHCGACHDGKTAWGVGFDTCNRCHTGE